MTSGKNKGSTFERLMCKQLSLLVSKGQRSDLYWRSAMSGGRATIQYRRGEKNKTQTGDISSLSNAGEWLTDQFIIELKHYANLQLPQSMIRGHGNLYTFWKKLVNDCNNHDKSPCLIARQNNFPIVVITETEFPIGLGRIKLPSPVITLHKWNADIYLFDEIMKAQPIRKKLDIELDEKPAKKRTRISLDEEC